MNVLDIFSGIGGFSLGLERAGMRTVAFCEIDPFCRRVIAKHWSAIPCYDDVRTLTAERLAADGLSVDVICGGFPCQDVSLAGNRAGMDGQRSGLWGEYARLIRELRPRFAIVENTPGLLSLGIGRVIGDLAEVGYDAEWHSIPAAALGADHERDRVWIIAYPHGTRIQPYVICRWQRLQEEMDSHAADPHDQGQLQPQGTEREEWRRSCNCPQANDADADGARCARRRQAGAIGENAGILGAWVRYCIDSAYGLSGEHWNHQPVLGRGLHGIPNRVDRARALGNAVLPAIATLIGKAIMEAEHAAR